jgi:SGNH domain (fused to AT3 domains)
MRVRVTRSSALGAVALVVALALSSSSLAATPPASPAQVKADVASSTSVASLPSNLKPQLADAPKDTAYVTTPSLAPCNTLGTTLKPSKCTFGDTRGKKTMVLWGDSHAFMWFPALNAIAKSIHWKLVALLQFGCPVAKVSVWNPLTKRPYQACDSFRKNMITTINKLNPALVVMSEAFTSQAATGGGANGTITNAQWQAGLLKTLKALHATGAHKVLLGSTVSSGAMFNPTACLAAYPTQVQKCTIPDTAAQQSQRAAEVAAAKSAKVFYVDVLPWLCTSSPTMCAPIIGDATLGYKVVYYSTGHVTETYALFLATVLHNALTPHLH